MKSFNTLSLVAIALAVLTLPGCGKSLSGTYAGDANAPFDTLTFKSNGKVQVRSRVMGSTIESTYEVDGKDVKLTNAGQTQVLKMDDQGRLDGGGMMGKYYLIGSDSKQMFGTYGSNRNDEKMEFRPGGWVSIRGTRFGTLFGSYRVDGTKVTVTTERTVFVDSQTVALTIDENGCLKSRDGQKDCKQ